MNTGTGCTCPQCSIVRGAHEPTITFHGSVTDLATDVAPFLRTRDQFDAFVEQLRKKVRLR